MKRDLKRLFRNKHICNITEELAGTSLQIKDTADNLIHEYYPKDRVAGDFQPDFQPVLLCGEVIGHVAAGTKTTALSALISHLLVQENEKKELGKETLERYRELSLLFNITDKLSANQNPVEVARLIIDEVAYFIKGDRILVMLFNEDTGYLEYMSGYAKTGFISDNYRIKPGEGILGDVFLTGKGEIINDVSEDKRFIPGKDTISSVICSPLKIKERVIGVIGIMSNEPVNYTADNLKLLSALTLQAAAAIENAKLYDSLKETFVTAIYTLAEAIEKRDPYTGGHTRRVMEYSLRMAEEMDFSPEEKEKLKYAAILHDIGKIGIRDDILLKNGRLDDNEFDQIKKHPGYGEDLLKHIKYFKDIIPGVKYHHERHDGRGYPEGLKGDEIHIMAKIIAVGDAFDAMTSNRTYRKSLPLEIAYGELRKNAGSQFDPAVVDVFFRVVSQDKMFQKG